MLFGNEFLLDVAVLKVVGVGVNGPWDVDFVNVEFKFEFVVGLNAGPEEAGAVEFSVEETIPETVPVISGRLKGIYPLNVYVPILPITGALVGIRHKPPTNVLDVVAVTLHPVTIAVEVEKQLVIVLPDSEAVLQRTKRSVTVCAAVQPELDDSCEVWEDIVVFDSWVLDWDCSGWLVGSSGLSSPGGGLGPLVQLPTGIPRILMQGR
jgi:hypothetical protein